MCMPLAIWLSMRIKFSASFPVMAVLLLFMTMRPQLTARRPASQPLLPHYTATGCRAYARLAVLRASRHALSSTVHTAGATSSGHAHPFAVGMEDRGAGQLET